MLLSKYPKIVIKDLKLLYKDFNNIVINDSQQDLSNDLKVLKKKFKTLKFEPNISIMTMLILKKKLNIDSVSLFNKIFLIVELYYIGFTLHLNVSNSKFNKQSNLEESPNKTYQVLLGDFLFTKIFEILLSINNQEILKAFTKFNKKISEGMLDISNTNDETYSAFIKLCFESICIIKPGIDKTTLFTSMKNVEKIFSLINFHKNVHYFKLINDKSNLDIKNEIKLLKIDDPNFDYYIDYLIAKL